MCFQNYNQEKYALQREVELKSRMLESLSCECEALRQQQKAQLEQLEMQLHRSHRQEVHGLRDKVWICVRVHSLCCMVICKHWARGCVSSSSTKQLSFSIVTL